MPDRYQDGSVIVHEPGRRTDPGKVPVKQRSLIAQHFICPS